MRTHLITALFLSFLFACSSHSDDVQRVLNQAGDNRKELEQLLEYYSKKPEDSLKLKAAYFLIKNMANKYSITGENAEKLDHIYRLVNHKPIKERSKFFRTYGDSLQVGHVLDETKDINHITAAYLIEQIEDAFDVWESTSWGKHYDFDIFCEYVLPYRLTTERLTSWRKPVKDLYPGMMEKLSYEGGHRYEAEKAIYDGGKDVEIATASEGRGVRISAEEGNKIIFSGLQRGFSEEKVLYIMYYNGGAEAEVSITNGDSLSVYSLPSTDGWEKLSPESKKVFLHFPNEKNEIVLRSLKNSVIIDYIEISSNEDYHLTEEARIVSGGTYFIKNKADGLSLTMEHPPSEFAPVLVAKPFKGDSVQKFDVILADYGFHKFKPIHTRGLDKCLDLQHVSRSDGAGVWLWDDLGGANQHWAIIALDSGYCKIVNKNSGKVLEVPEKAEGPILKVVQRSYTGDDRQKWKFELLERPSNQDELEQLLPESAITASYRTADIARDFQWYLLEGNIPPVNALDLTQIKAGNCREEAHFMTYVSRAFGIPVTVDYTPQWPFRSMGHDWNVIIDQQGKGVPFYFNNKPRAHTIYDEYPKAKVFRTIYSENPESLAKIKSAEEVVPELFENPQMLDVTHEYVKTTDVTVKLEWGIPDNTNFAYLTVFNDQSWVPIYWGEIKGEQVTFKNMGRGIVYLPVFYTKNGNYVAGNAFHLSDSGEVKMIIPNLDHKQAMVVDRKYSMIRIGYHASRMMGGKFQGANKADFSDSVTLFNYEQVTEGKYCTLPIKNEDKFKYLRYIGAAYSHSTINELIFYEENDRELKGEVIGTLGSLEGGATIDKAFDRNILTYFEAPVPIGGWVGLELHEPAQVSKIRFMPRTDGNCIEPGDEYELVYWDKSWVSTGRQIATTDSLIFKNVPSDALYLLHNHTKGREERIFTYENGKQVWW